MWFGRRRVPAKGYAVLLPGDVGDKKEFSRAKFFRQGPVKKFPAESAEKIVITVCRKNCLAPGIFSSVKLPGEIII